MSSKVPGLSDAYNEQTGQLSIFEEKSFICRLYRNLAQYEAEKNISDVDNEISER